MFFDDLYTLPARYRQNCRYWSSGNPDSMREEHVQDPEKVNVQAGIVGEHGLLFL